MTIASTPSTISYSGDGVSTVFTIPFKFDTSADLKVIETTSGNPVVVTTGFSIGGGGGAPGTLTRSVALPVGTTLTILDNPEQTQPVDYSDNDAFPAETHEGALDRVTRLCKRLYQQVQTSLRVVDGDPASGGGMELGSVDARKGKYLFFNAVTGAIEYAVNLAVTTLSQSIIAQLLNPQTDKEAALGITPTNYLYTEGHAFRYMTPAQRADVLAYGYTLDVTAAVQAALNTGKAYTPAGGYLHAGLTITAQDTVWYGDSFGGTTTLGTAFKYSGTGSPVTVASGAHRFKISDLHIRGNATMVAGSANLKITAAGNGRLERVGLSADGNTRTLLTLQEATFYLLCHDCFFDGELTAATGILMQDNGAASGPNGARIKDTRVQQCTTCVDIVDGNNLTFEGCNFESGVTTGVKVRTGVRTVKIADCRFDWNVAASIGVDVDVGAQGVVLDCPHSDVGGAGAVLLRDNGSGTLYIDGDHITGTPVFNGSVDVADLAGNNPFYSWTTGAGQKAVAQIVGALLDFVGLVGIGFRWRANASANAHLGIDTAGNVVVGSAAIATNATDGFLYVPTCPGVPTGTPTSKAGLAPIVIDSTDNRLYFYSSGAWRNAGP